MTPDEIEREIEYRTQERLGMLYGKDEVTPEQFDQAQSDAVREVDGMKGE